MIPEGGDAPSHREKDRERTAEGVRGPQRSLIGEEDSSLVRSRRILTDLFGPPEARRFAVRYWDGRLDRPAAEPAFTVMLAWPGALRHMLLPPIRRSLGAAYVEGHGDVEGNLEAAVAAVRPALEALASPVRLARLVWRLLGLPRSSVGSGRRQADLRGVSSRSGRRHSRVRDARSVRYHYDVDAEFFRLFLDPWMQYSSGRFSKGKESLREAQEAKLELICRKLELGPGHRLLDVGCGWGGLLHFAAERHGVEATGITLSPPQARAARQRLAKAGLDDRSRVLVTDYRDMADDVRYDRVVSVGMVEHVGHRRMSDYFRAVFDHLEPGGLFLNQGIVTRDDAPPRWRRLRKRLTVPWSSFVDRYVFPDGELVTTAERIGPAERAGFELRSVESLGEHYSATLRHWVRRLEARRDEAVELVGEPTYRVWRLYMAGAAHAFDSGSLGVIQELYRKPADA